MCEREYVSGEYLTDDDIDAFDTGQLVEWRRGSDGVMWYRRVSVHAEPPQTFPDIYSIEGSADEL